MSVEWVFIGENTVYRSVLVSLCIAFYLVLEVSWHWYTFIIYRIVQLFDEGNC